MRIGVPKEIKTQEFRVGMTPAGVATLVQRGHTVLVEQGFVKEPKQTIAQLLETLGADATVRRFVRVKIGE